MPVYYSLDDTINSFFESHSGVTRQQCDGLAISLVGGSIKPAPIQGASSYTVIAGAEQSKVVQFRDQSSPLNMEDLKLAQSIYGRFVVDCSYHGQIGQPSSLSVYLTKRLPGTTYIEARCMNSNSDELSLNERSRQSNTVVDFARFFAASWIHRQIQPLDVIEAIHREYEKKLSLLSQALPSRFAESLRQIRAQLPLLFAPTYPLVLNHDDLCEMNIFVDPSTGHITGIIDWADARILPFGISLWGVENMLGYMDSKGWHYHPDHHELEKLFWQTFEEAVGGISEAERQAISVARMAGLFLRHGFTWEGGVRQIPVEGSDSALEYLDAFCISGEVVPT